MTDQTSTTKPNRGLPGTIVSIETRTNVKGGSYLYGKLSYVGNGKSYTTTIIVNQYSPSQIAAFEDLKGKVAGDKVDLFGNFQDVMIEGKRVGAMFSVLKSGGRPARTAKAA